MPTADEDVMHLSGGTRLWLRLIALAALVAVAAMVLSRLINAPVLLWDVAWTASALAAHGGTLLGRRRASAANRFRWTMWVAATGCWLLGQLAWNAYGSHVPPSPNLGDAGWWGFAICATIGVMRTPVRSRSLRTVAMVETVPLIAAALALTCAELWPYVGGSPLSVSAQIAVLGYPALYVGAAIVTLQALLGGWMRGESSTASRLILAGIATQAITFVFWSEQLLTQTYVQGSNVLDPLFVVGLLVMAAGGVWAAVTPDSASAANEPASRGGLLPGVVFVLLCAALIKAQITLAELAPRVVLAGGLLFCGGGLMLRSHLLSRRLGRLLERERGIVADLAERESELGRMNERLVEDSRHDPLTGMRNRRALAYDLPRIESDHRARHDQFAIAVCDVDHFKAYNDQLGHLAGDQALRALSGIVRGALREHDIGYRFGGEELLLVLPNTRAGEALRAAERVRRAVLDAALPHPVGIDGVLTASIGVAAGDGDAAVLLARADAALYEAKRAGRNRVVLAGERPGVEGLRRRSSDDDAVPRQLRSMLAVSRAAASGTGPVPVLQALAETIRMELSFEVVAVNLRDFAQETLEIVVVLGDENARSALLGKVNPWSEFQAVMGAEQERCGAFFLPAGTAVAFANSWVPDLVASGDSESWDPDDMLLLPIRGADGEVLAIASVDNPRSGLRPLDDELSVLMAVADHAGLALERAQRERLEAAALREQSAELRLAAVMLLAETLDLRDPSTGRHSRTVGELARRTATELGVAAERVDRIHAAGVLHDLGKLGIADAVLYKPRPLDDHEWREMKRHPEIGARILDHAGLHDIAQWVRAHHERVDGRGYPDGLIAAEIPLEATILAVSDAYEAMIADRPYRKGMPVADARDELMRCAGTQFDPAVVHAFLIAVPDTLGEDLEAAGAALDERPGELLVTDGRALSVFTTD
jgi:diguanylate cyclase (GGDEF)-like protein